MMQKLSMAAAILLLLFSRLAPGLRTERAEDTAALQKAAARLDSAPLSVGPWQGFPLPALDSDAIAEAKLAGHLWRRYRHSLTGSTVSVLLVCGPVEPICLHSPDVCYRGSGYLMVGCPLSATVRPPSPARPAAFRTAEFRKTNAAIPEHLRIYWSWNAQGSWEAPESPLRTFASAPVLYKVYAISDAPRPNAEASSDEGPCKEFLDVFLPELQKALFPEVPTNNR